MAHRPVHWHEGMFMGPQHLQAAQRYEAAQRAKAARSCVRYNWGMVWVELNQTALANYRFEVQSLRAVLRDGTVVDVPADGALPALDLREPLAQASPLTILLALPQFRTGRPNAGAGAAADGVRFLVETQDLEDENTGATPQPVTFRLLNLRLVASAEQRHAGLEALPIARVVKSGDANPAPKLDETYIPPVLGCDAWQQLYVGIIRAIYDQIGAHIERLATQVETRGIGIDSHATEDTRIVGRLRELNEAYCVLGVLAFAEGVHPREAYTELCRIVGQLSIFRKNQSPRAPDLPRYDHDDLGTCFYTVKRHIDDLLGGGEFDFHQRIFVGAGRRRLQVAVEPSWLEPAYQMFIAADTPLSPQQCVDLFTKPGQLAMKVGSSERVERLFDYGQVGLRFQAVQAPRALPAGQRLTYFQVDRIAQPAEWQAIRESLTIAICINEPLIAGAIDQQTTITIRHGQQQIPVRLTLYVIDAAKLRG